MVIPILATADLAKSLDFYTGKLGWTKVFGMPEPEGHDVFAIVSMNDGVTFGLSALPAPDPKGNGVVLMCYVDEEADIDTYYAECTARDTPIAREIRDEYWGDRCFDVTDTDGYVLCVCKTVRPMAPEEIAAAAGSA